MTKQEFLRRLEAGLLGLPQEDIAGQLAFFSEMIDDRIEEGATEEEAIAGIGSPEDAAQGIIEETPLPRIIRERIRPKRRLSVLEIILLVLGSPIWLSLACAAFAVTLSLYVVIWALIITLWAVFVSLALSGAASLVVGILLIFKGQAAQGGVLIGSALMLCGLSIFLFFACLGASKGACILTKKIALGIKNLFVRKEKAQ